MEHRVRTKFSNPRAKVGTSSGAIAIAAASVLSLIHIPVQAADEKSTWISSVGNWSAATNWSNVPTLADFPNNGAITFDVEIGAGQVTQSGNISVQSLLLNGNASLSNTSNLTTLDLFTFEGATLAGAGTFNANGGTLLQSGNHIITQHALNLSGLTQWNGGDVLSGQGAVITNNGTFQASFDGAFNNGQGGATSVFTNNGVFQKTGGTGSLKFASQFNNNGSVSIESGSVVLSGGGALKGAFDLSAGTSLEISGGISSISSNTTFAGAGAFRATGGTFTGGSNVAFNQFDMIGGTFSSGSLTANRLNWSGGTISGVGTILISPTATLNILPTASVTLTQRTISNSGTTSWSSGTINSGVGAVFNNSGTFTTTVDGSWLANKGGPTLNFNNSGVFQKNDGTGRSSISIAFNNTGTVTAHSGTLSFFGGGSSSGSFVMDQGAVMEFGSYWFTPATVFSGQGILRITGSVTDSTANLPDQLEMTAGDLILDLDLAPHHFTWSGGKIEGQHRLNISADATLLVNANNSVMWNGQNVTNAGLITVASGSLQINSPTATVENTGTIDFQSNGALSSGTQTVFNNLGLFVKSSGTGITAIAPILNNTGTIRAETGTLAIGTGTSTGSFYVASNAVFGFGGTFKLKTGATLSGPGLFRLGVPGTMYVDDEMTLQNLELKIGSWLSDKNLTITHSLLWSGSASVQGAAKTIISPQATLTISSATIANIGRELDNYGTASWTRGEMSGGDLTPVKNYGSFEMTFDGRCDADFLNFGTFIKSGGTGSSFISNFSNQGTVRVDSGRLYAQGFGTSVGSFQIASGARLYFAAQTLNPGATITGDGMLGVDFGDSYFNRTTVNVGGIDVNFAHMILGQSAVPASHALVTKSVTITPQSDSQLDLSNNALIVAYGTGASPIATLRGFIQSAYAGGAWSGDGITSSAAAANSRMALGYAEASEVLGVNGGTFADQTVDGHAVLIRYTLAGDADLNGAVNFSDLVTVAQNYGRTLSQITESWWEKGDFNYDGVVDFADLVTVAQNYGGILPSDPLPGAAANFQTDFALALNSVPEPGSSAIAIAGGLALLFRRRERRAATRGYC